MSHPVRNRPVRIGLLLGAGLAAALFAGSVQLASRWAEEPASADGRILDWERKLPVTKIGDALIVGFCNDADDLYILFSPDWTLDARRPLSARLTLRLEPGGDKARTLELDYSGTVPNRPGMQPGAGGPPPDAASGSPPQGAPGSPPGTAPGGRTPDRPGAAPANGPGMEAGEQLKLRVGSGEWTALPTDGSRGPRVQRDDSWGACTYRWRIPLRADAGGGRTGLALKAGETVTVGIYWAPKHGEKGEPSRPRMYDGGLGGDGDMPGGEMAGARHGGMGVGMGPPPGAPERDALPGRKKVRIVLSLAASRQ